MALVNAAGLIAVALVSVYEAYRRLAAPPQVAAGVLTLTAAAALAVNLGTACMVGLDRTSHLGLRSAFVHLAADAVASLGAMLAGTGIAITGWRVLDPAVSVLIGSLIVYDGWRIARETVDILLESTPSDVAMPAMVSDLRRLPGVRGVHDLHVWSINQNMRALSAHILVDDVSISQGAAIQNRINHLLRDQYGIDHATLQLECSGCEPDQLFCQLNDEPTAAAASPATAGFEQQAKR